MIYFICLSNSKNNRTNLNKELSDLAGKFKLYIMMVFIRNRGL